MEILTTNNLKILKGDKEGYLSAILHLAPSNVSGVGNVCPSASPGCIAVCLNTAGHGRYDNVQQARIRRTKLYFLENAEFNAQVQRDIERLKRKAKKLGKIPVIRLNGTSDLPGMAREFARANPDITFYDYTALAKPYARQLPNYHLTFSLKENNLIQAMDALENGINVAAVFDELPETYLGYPVINGDENDLRFLDPSPVIIGLTEKGRARHDKTGFVIRIKAPVEKKRKKMVRVPGALQIHPNFASQGA